MQQVELLVSLKCLDLILNMTTKVKLLLLLFCSDGFQFFSAHISIKDHLSYKTSVRQQTWNHMPL